MGAFDVRKKKEGNETVEEKSVQNKIKKERAAECRVFSCDIFCSLFSCIHTAA